MQTKILMISSAFVMGILGLMLLFLPEEFLSLLGETTSPPIAKFIQLLGALYVAFAEINWIARRSLIGGIYGRPLVAGNFTHFFLGTLLFLRELRFAPIPFWILTAMSLYVVFAVFFGRLLFTLSNKEEQAH